MSRSLPDTEISRKVQSVGGSSFTVSLPKGWATEQGLSAGNEVFLYPHDDGTLVVRVSKPSDEEAPSLSVGDLSPDQLPWVVRAFYLAGEDRFALRPAERFSAEERRTITAAGTDLVGLEVADESAERVSFQSMQRSERLSVGQSVLNLRYVTLSMQREATNALLSGDDALARDVLDRPDDVARQFALVGRCVERRVALPPGPDRPDVDRRTALDYYAIARELRGIASCAERVAAVAVELDDPPSGDPADELADYARRARTVAERGVEATLNGCVPATAYDALDRYGTLSAEYDVLDRSRFESEESETDPYYLSLLLDAVGRTADHGGTIAERALKMGLCGE